MDAGAGGAECEECGEAGGGLVAFALRGREGEMERWRDGERERRGERENCRTVVAPS